VRLFKKGTDNWRDVPLSHPYAENSRGLGVLDLVESIQENRPNRASGAIAFHVLDAMRACLESSQSGRAVKLQGLARRDEAMPVASRVGV
jgi:hypothetical protein